MIVYFVYLNLIFASSGRMRRILTNLKAVLKLRADNELNWFFLSGSRSTIFLVVKSDRILAICFVLLFILSLLNNITLILFYYFNICLYDKFGRRSRRIAIKETILDEI